MPESVIHHIRKIVPDSVYKYFQPLYHWLLSCIGAVWYRFPSRSLNVIGVTGTKGKSSTLEILNAILEEAGHVTAISSTIRTKIANDSKPNLHKMTMPGRFFIQKFLRSAVKKSCDYVLIEMTSQGVLNHRHRFIDLDMLIVTNISPEHIEAHGSYEKYVASKIEIAKQLARSSKKHRTLILNGDDVEYNRFLACSADAHTTYHIADAKPYTLTEHGLEFTFASKLIRSPIRGLFNIYNMLAAATAAHELGIPLESIVRGIEKLQLIPGRVYMIHEGQAFTVVVDYAHTPDSLEKLYQTFTQPRDNRSISLHSHIPARTICVLGGTGGGRDTWKRSHMGRIADTYCDTIILTDEDPYDEDPRSIVSDVARGITSQQPSIIMDRRAAIREALHQARPGDHVLITGKGTDPYIMGPRGTKIPWSDIDIARDELKNLTRKTD